MDGMQPDQAGSSLVSIIVLSVTPARAGKLFALASVEIDIDGVQIEVHGIRALRAEPAGTRIELPKFRDATGILDLRSPCQTTYKARSAMRCSTR